MLSLVQVWPAQKIRLHAAVALTLALLGVLAWLLGAAGWVGALVAVLAGLAWYVWGTSRYYRRRKLVSEPFPEHWRALLDRRVPFYSDLDEPGRARFEDDVRIFLAEQRIYGAGVGTQAHEVDDEAKLLIAASAAMLGHGLPNWEWPRLRDIVIHPRSFDEEYRGDGEHPDIAGMVHHQGPILYSEQDLKMGFRRHDGHNVGLHELAHVLDLADGRADGVPIGVGWAATAPWIELVTDRLRELHQRRRKAGVLRDYAGTNEAEFFAVAVEAFFERPQRLRDKDPELYSMLAEYFNLDPAAREGRRDPRKYR